MSSILSLFVLLFGVGYAHHRAVDQLREHLRLLREWAAGHAGGGWSEDDITPADRLKWMMPTWSIIPNFSGAAISQLTLLQSIALHPSLIPYLVRTAQSIETFNHAIARHEAFKTSRPDLYLDVQEKIRKGLKGVFGTAGEPPADATQEAVNAVAALAALAPEEQRYANTLRSILASVHLQTIGSPGGSGLRQHVGELVREFERFHGPLA